LERQTKTGGRAVVLLLVRTSCYVLFVPLPPPTALRPPHRTENEACCVLKNAVVKQPSVRSLPFKTERFIAGTTVAVSPLWQKTARAH